MRLAAVAAIALFASGIAGFAEGPTFDVASVKLAGPGAPLGSRTGGPGTNDPGRFRTCDNIFMLLSMAFDVSGDQIAGPAWIRDTMNMSYYYAIDATMPPSTTKEGFRAMLQNLLVERFLLVFHHETRNFPGYALVVDKGGPKLKVVTPTPGTNPDADNFQAIIHAPKGPDGFPDFPGPYTRGVEGPGGLTRIKYQEQTMAEFASDLTLVIGRSQGRSALDSFARPRVVDKTGLTGEYTFILEYYDALQAGRRRSPAQAASDSGNGAAPAASEPDNAPNILTAIQKQLGLRLVKTAGIPLDIIVVESLDKVPTAN